MVEGSGCMEDGWCIYTHFTLPAHIWGSIWIDHPRECVKEEKGEEEDKKQCSRWRDGRAVTNPFHGVEGEWVRSVASWTMAEEGDEQWRHQGDALWCRDG